jgi:hypothetical protein
MRHDEMKRPAFVALLLCGLLAASHASALTVKYEFTRDSPNVGLVGANKDFCAAGTWLSPSGAITFTDTYLGGNPVTFQAGFQCQSAPSPVTVNGTFVGNLGASTGGCCVNSFSAPSLNITSQYNNGSSVKTVSSTGYGGSLMPLSGLFNTVDPMFRISVTLLPGISSPTPGGFTNLVLPNFTWAAVPGAASYELQVSIDPFFTTPMVLDQTPIPGTSYQLTVGNILTNGVSYYVRLKANGGSFGGIPSYITDFTVAQTIPTTPVLVSPPNPSNVSSQTPTFNWNPVTLGSE